MLFRSTQGFKREGDIIAVLGVTYDDLAASEYAQTVLGHTTDELIVDGVVPRIDLDQEKRMQETLLRLADKCLLNSAHDCSDGGLAVAIADCCFSSLGRKALGAEIDLKNNGLSAEALLFGESPSRIVISFKPENIENVKMAAVDCPFEVIGHVGGDNLNISVNNEAKVTSSIADLETAWSDSLKSRLEN